MRFAAGTTLVLDGAGHAHATLSTGRSGTANITAKVATRGFSGLGSTPLVRARRRSVAVFVSGASTYTTCTAPGVCGDPFNAFAPIRNALTAQGFAAADLATFGYGGGAIDPTTHAWVPNASTCADSALDYKVQVSRLSKTISQIAAANPNSDVSVVGLSQGGLLAFQMLAAQTRPLPKGTRLANVITLDGVVGGIPLTQVLNLQTASGGATTCWTREAPRVPRHSSSPSGTPPRRRRAPSRRTAPRSCARSSGSPPPRSPEPISRSYAGAPRRPRRHVG